jgi:hydrogenase maturation protein HypF
VSGGDGRAAHRIEVCGTVQGVGFRPFVHRLGSGLGVDGWVRNDDGRVVILAAGPPEVLAVMAARLRSDAPPLARISDVRVAEPGAGDGPAPPRGSGFRVEASASRAGGPARAPGSAPAPREVPPDVATCDACLAELFDPRDRRHRYPFVNCTDCGPRATIIDALPYDRERTTMRAFTMCAECAREYADPADRRFHAEPVACPACGPRLSWWSPAGEAGLGAAGKTTGEDALAAAVKTIDDGGTVALKGLGGYQLVCDAADGDAVARLRARKRRPAKPFAVMVADLDAARSLARPDAAEAALLASPERPVVLVRPAESGNVDSSPGTRLAGAVGAGAPRVGLFLPCTPLHHLLLAETARPLVVTSGNLAEEPIVIDDGEARERLVSAADGFLHHDRMIRAGYDDSVTRVVAGRPSVIRRARGCAPRPVRLPRPADEPVLAVGAQLKHTFTLAHGSTAVVGPHTGDLEQREAMDAFERTLAHLSRLVGVEPRVVAHDLHPDYLSTRFAVAHPAGRRIAVQHHHAHVASCAAEHGVTGRFIGVAYDGLGLGDDGTLWGGEVLLADLVGYRRMGRFGRAPLPGGAAAVRRPARMALGYLLGAERLDGERTDGDGGPGPTAGSIPYADSRPAAPFLDRLPPREVAVVARMIDRRVNCPLASSAGRLFDAAAALLGLRDDATYEGEAAVALEAAATGYPSTAGHPAAAAAGELAWRLVHRDGMLVYDPRPTLRALLEGLHDGADAGLLAARFHATIAAVTVAFCTDVAGRTGVRTVCLSGGVMQNNLLAGTLLHALAGAGLEPLLNEQVPVNDGGVSYGQAAVAAARLGGKPVPACDAHAGGRAGKG